MPNKVLILPKPSLFSFKECLWFLDRGFDECLHKVSINELRKALPIEDKPVIFSIHESTDHLVIQILKGYISETGRQFLSNYIIDWLDLNRDLQTFYSLLDQNQDLAYMSKSFCGLRLIAIENLFEALSWSIIGQQINLVFAYKLKRRLVEAFGTKVEFKGQNFYIFPTAEALANVSIEELKLMQFSTNKARYLIGVAQAFAQGVMSKEQLVSLNTFEEKRNALTSLKGIGIWTANYALMKSLKERTAIPYGDVGLLKALENHKLISNRSENDKIDALFRKFEGWESYLVFYLWRSLATGFPG
jgi:DNA-3-methyladenine glycosylase II